MTLERNTGISKEETLTKKQKDALMVAWAALSIGGATALAFFRGLAGDIGVGIFMANILAPGVVEGGKIIKDIIKPKVRI